MCVCVCVCVCVSVCVCVCVCVCARAHMRIASLASSLMHFTRKDMAHFIFVLVLRGYDNDDGDNKEEDDGWCY